MDLVLVIIVILVIVLFSVALMLDNERHKRRQFETIVAKIRDGQELNKQEATLRQSAQQCRWLNVATNA